MAAVGDREVQRDMSDSEQDAIVRRVFDKFDKDSSGQISASEVQSLLQELGRTEEEAVRGAKAMIAYCDVDNDGEISYDEFKSAMWHCLDT